LEHNYKKELNNIYILLENAGDYPLKKIIENKKMYDEYKDKIIDNFQFIYNAIKYLHKLNIYHRDIKLQNIVYNHKTNTLKIIDLGLACNFNYGNCNNLSGTKSYFPSNYVELFKNKKNNLILEIFDKYAFSLTCLLFITNNNNTYKNIYRENSKNVNIDKFVKLYFENIEAKKNSELFLNLAKYLKYNEYTAKKTKLKSDLQLVEKQLVGLKNEKNHYSSVDYIIKSKEDPYYKIRKNQFVIDNNQVKIFLLKETVSKTLLSFEK
jgi:serine/threonine protein kinase